MEVGSLVCSFDIMGILMFLVYCYDLVLVYV